MKELYAYSSVFIENALSLPPWSPNVLIIGIIRILLSLSRWRHDIDMFSPLLAFILWGESVDDRGIALTKGSKDIWLFLCFKPAQAVEHDAHTMSRWLFGRFWGSELLILDIPPVAALVVWSNVFTIMWLYQQYFPVTKSVAWFMHHGRCFSCECAVALTRVQLCCQAQSLCRWEGWFTNTVLTNGTHICSSRILGHQQREFGLVK